MTGDIRIYGEVGKHVTFESVIKNIDPKYDSYDVHIMSPGGDVFEGYAIYNALKNTGKNITVYIEGLCASIATLIAGAGDKIIMNKQSQFMIHNPLVSGTTGDANDLRNVADQLDKIKTQLIDVYTRRTGLPQETLWAMYDKETWLLPEQALEMGFVDEVVESLKAVATANTKTFKNMEKNQNSSKILNAITDLGKKITALLAPETVKNQMTDALADGTVIVVLTEDEDWTGKQVVYEDGTALPDGDHTLASGKVITVSGGIITQVQDPAPDNTAPEDVTALKSQLEAATKEIGELKSALEARNATATKAEAQAETFKNGLKEAQTELNKIKNMSVGTGKAPDLGVKKAPDGMNQGKVYDPMGDMIIASLKGRNLINDNEE